MGERSVSSKGVRAREVEGVRKGGRERERERERENKRTEGKRQGGGGPN